MKKTIHFSCPLDCFDTCGLTATVEDNRVVDVRGDKSHPLTRGACCAKGRKLLERTYHPQRLTSPLKRTESGWAEITWDQAIEEMAGRFTACIDRYGSNAILLYSYSGYGGLIKKVDEVFCNHLGGVTVGRGSLCWGAGTAAQLYDFGAVRGHHPADLAKATTIILWGRNPADTNMHLMPSLQKARKAGATLVVIDPRRSATAESADIHLKVKPATDGALALGMANIIIEKGRHDSRFIAERVQGFESFQEYVQNFSPEQVEKITGVSAEDIIRLAEIYSQNRPAAIVIGYGLQRYANGGNTVRCIDALGAITGNIGISGGGVNYANHRHSGYMGGELKQSRTAARNRRTFSMADFGGYLESENDPPIQCVLVSKANPLVQGPDINQTLEAFNAVEFKVVIDMFMTDTARNADLVLPCTSVLEEEDIIYTSMFSPYLNYSAKVVDPPDSIISEYDLFTKLARRMNLSSYPYISQKEFLKRAIQPLTDAFGIDLESLKKSGHYCLPESEIPWQEGPFDTPSGKYELYSESARDDGQHPLPTYVAPQRGSSEYPLQLLTPHLKASLHSQHFLDVDEQPPAFLHPDTLQKYDIKDGDTARLKSRRGELKVTARHDDHLAEDIIVVYQGWWHKSGSVNFLTSIATSEMGEQAAYYDCFCSIESL